MATTRPAIDHADHAAAYRRCVVSGIRLAFTPDQWWNGRVDGSLVIDTTRIEPVADEDGRTSWAVVEGWRIGAGGRRTRSRELVRVNALPLEIRTDIQSGRGIPNHQNGHKE